MATKRLLASVTALVCAFAVSAATAHELKTAGPYDVELAMVNEPPVTQTLNGVELVVQRHADHGPVDNLEKSLDVTIVAPDGTTTRSLPLVAMDEKPGHYTSPFILSQPGVYSFHVTGFIGSTKVDLTFESDEVAPASSITFP